MEWLGTALIVVVLVAVVLWPLTLGRRYFAGERKTPATMRRDLYTSSYDEGSYPLDPPPAGAEQRPRRE